MSLQGYLDNIQAKSRKTPADFKILPDKNALTEKEKLKDGVKATQITDWLKQLNWDIVMA